MKFTSLFILVLLFTGNLFAQAFELGSPDGKIKLGISITSGIEWNLNYENSKVIEKGSFAVRINETLDITSKLKVISKKQTTITEQIINPVPTKFRMLEVTYNTLLVNFNNNFSVEFRLYNEGFAYRISTKYKNELTVNDEAISLTFPENSRIFFPQETMLQSHYERVYIDTLLQGLKTNSFASLPLLVKNPSGINVLITDADLYDYPCMFLQKAEGNTLKSLFPKVVLKAIPAERGADRNELIKEEANYIAKTTGSRSFPWRVFALAVSDKNLLENQLVYNLSRIATQDFSWVKPGKVAWDWWNDNNIWGVDFKSGINMPTYKYYVDFASEYNLEYVILDEGWSATTENITESIPGMNIPELVKYAKSKNVNIILWVLWKPLWKDIDKVLEKFEQWGVSGIKVDFMQRADQEMVNIYEQIAEKAAGHKMLVDFHGAFKPGGLSRAYPNVVSYEGVKGLENVKWSKQITPHHNLTLPFIRMVAGPMDYTPGAMINRQEKDFNISWSQPMSMGTRAHQVALYIAFESPLQMLADNPSNYRKEKECTRFIAEIPAVWDYTHAIDAKIGEYLIIARKSGDNWYVAALSDWTERELEIDLSFLENKNWDMQILEDGINANKHAEDYKIYSKSCKNTDNLKVKLAKGGGFSAIITPVD